MRSKIPDHLADAESNRIVTNAERIHRARGWRSRVLIAQLRAELETYLAALAPDSRDVVSSYIPRGAGDGAVGLPQGQEYHKWMATCGEWVGTGRTEAGALARLLAVLLDGAIRPLT